MRPRLAWLLVLPLRKDLQQSYRETHFSNDVRPTPLAWGYSRIIELHGPEVEDWPDEVGVQFWRITRHNLNDRRSYDDFVEEMRAEYGYKLVMAQNSLEEGRFCRFQRDYDHPGWKDYR